MINTVTLVGRIARDLEITENEEGKKVLTIVVAVPRQYKNINGEYETDFIPCVLWNDIGKKVSEYCQKGDLVGVKGRVQSNDGQIKIMAEQVTFLSSSASVKKSEEE